MPYFKCSLLSFTIMNLKAVACEVLNIDRVLRTQSLSISFFAILRAHTARVGMSHLGILRLFIYLWTVVQASRYRKIDDRLPLKRRTRNVTNILHHPCTYIHTEGKTEFFSHIKEIELITYLYVGLINFVKTYA